MNPASQNTPAEPVPIVMADGLWVDFEQNGVAATVIHGASLELYPEQTVGILGEHGAGKSALARSLLRLLPEPAAKLSGKVRICSKDNEIVEVEKVKQFGAELNALRGGTIGMVFADPLAVLSPAAPIGRQLVSTSRRHQPFSVKQAQHHGTLTLGKVGLKAPESYLKRLAHELSPEDQQRVAIALAIVGQPRLLICDEPTGQLDTTTGQKILTLLRHIQEEQRMGLCILSRIPGIIAQNCQYAGVMYVGRIIEFGDVHTLFKRPLHPYTQALLKTVPLPGQREEQQAKFRLTVSKPKFILAKRKKETKPRLPLMPGTPPQPDKVLDGCPFAPRCEHFIEGTCDRPMEVPRVNLDHQHWSRCYRAREI